MSALFRKMTARDPEEHHRAATPLELLFDLVFVIAIASAAVGLHHAIAENHAVMGTIRFALAFFAIWWAWMNYTWFASAYDNDDTVFRLLTMVIMAGALTMAAGIGALFDALDIRLTIAGYVIMRIAMVILWLRAAMGDPERRATALAYAGGIAIVQIYWVLIFLISPGIPAVFYLLFLIGGALELAVPVFAEKKAVTRWHRHHIIERYGLLNIIVLGETLLAGSMALETARDGEFDMALVHVALSALVIVFSMWWLYFSREGHLETDELSRALTWGYGHAAIFASGAAVGAGFAVLVDIITDHAEVGLTAGDYSVAIPLAVYLIGLWFVRDRFCLVGPAHYVLPIFAALIVVVPLTPLALEGVAGLALLSVITRSLIARQAGSRR